MIQIISINFFILYFSPFRFFTRRMINDTWLPTMSSNRSLIYDTEKEKIRKTVNWFLSHLQTLPLKLAEYTWKLFALFSLARVNTSITACYFVPKGSKYFTVRRHDETWSSIGVLSHNVYSRYTFGERSRGILEYLLLGRS